MNKHKPTGPGVPRLPCLPGSKMRPGDRLAPKWMSDLFLVGGSEFITHGRYPAINVEELIDGHQMILGQKNILVPIAEDLSPIRPIPTRFRRDTHMPETSEGETSGSISKHLQLLVATDVAARGLDVNDLTHENPKSAKLRYLWPVVLDSKGRNMRNSKHRVSAEAYKWFSSDTRSSSGSKFDVRDLVHTCRALQAFAQDRGLPMSAVRVVGQWVGESRTVKWAPCIPAAVLDDLSVSDRQNDKHTSPFIVTDIFVGPHRVGPLMRREVAAMLGVAKLRRVPCNIIRHCGPTCLESALTALDRRARSNGRLSGIYIDSPPGVVYRTFFKGRHVAAKFVSTELDQRLEKQAQPWINNGPNSWWAKDLSKGTLYHRFSQYVKECIC